MNKVIEAIKLEIAKTEMICASAYTMYTYYAEKADELMEVDRQSMTDNSFTPAYDVVYDKRNMYGDEVRRLDLACKGLRDCLSVLAKVSADQDAPVNTETHTSEVSDAVKRTSAKVRLGDS